jgi:hypothetical protein
MHNAQAQAPTPTPTHPSKVNFTITIQLEINRTLTLCAYAHNWLLTYEHATTINQSKPNVIIHYPGSYLPPPAAHVLFYVSVVVYPGHLPSTSSHLAPARGIFSGYVCACVYCNIFIVLVIIFSLGEHPPLHAGFCFLKKNMREPSLGANVNLYVSRKK